MSSVTLNPPDVDQKVYVCSPSPGRGLSVDQDQATHLVAGGGLDLGGQALGLGVGGQQVLGLVEAEAEDLGVEVVVLVPQLVVLLGVTETSPCLNLPVGFFLLGRQEAVGTKG